MQPEKCQIIYIYFHNRDRIYIAVTGPDNLDIWFVRGYLTDENILLTHSLVWYTGMFAVTI